MPTNTHTASKKFQCQTNKNMQKKNNNKTYTYICIHTNKK